MDPKQVNRSMIARVTHTRTRSGREALGLFSLEGTRAVERALRVGVALETVLIGEVIAHAISGREHQLVQALQAAGVTVHILPQDTMRDLTEGRDYGQIVALAPLPPQMPLPATGTYVVAVNIADPGNLGGMIRTILASGADGLISVGSSDPWHPRAVRTSMGSIFKLPIYRFEESALTALPAGTKIAASTSPSSTALPDLHVPSQTRFLFIGSEAFGLPEALYRQMDICVRIPMISGVDSYSVNVATGIALYQLLHAHQQQVKDTQS